MSTLIALLAVVSAVPAVALALWICDAFSAFERIDDLHLDP